MTDLERLCIAMRYRPSDIHNMLLSLAPDASNISDVAHDNNLPIEVIQRWYDLSQNVFGAYNLDRHRNPGFVEVRII